jgi:hypothetical protein
MDMTLHPASAVSTALEEVVEAYRLGMEGQASEHLVKLIDLLTSVLAKGPPEMVLRITPLLANAMSAIERKDYLYVADIFEYEIAPLLLGITRDAV